MKGPRSSKGLQVMLSTLVVVAAVVVTVLSTHGTFGKKPAAKAPEAPATGARTGMAAAAGQPSGGSPPPAPSTPSQATPPAPDQPREAVGRPNPFAPLLTRQRPLYAPQLGDPPRQSSRPLSPNPPAYGIDLPVPPGFTVPGGQAGVPPPPGAGMTVGAIIGGSERVAIIQAQGTLFIVGVGDHVGDAVVVEIRESNVVMRRGEVTFELRFGGEGA